MLVQEVSLVDRAANMRKFILMKRATPMQVKKEDAGAAAGQVAENAANEANAGATGTASGAMQAQVKEEVTAALADAAEKILAVATQLDGVEITDQPATPPVPEAVTKQIADLGAALTALATKYGAAAPANADDTAAATDGSAGKAAPPPATAPEGVMKAGRRMAKERLDRLGKAIDVLIGLMKELRYEDQKRAARSKAKASAKSAGPNAIITEAEIREMISGAEDVLASHGEITQALATAKADLTAARTKINALEKRSTPSNALPADPINAQPKAHVWPDDLAASARNAHRRPATAT